MNLRVRDMFSGSWPGRLGRGDDDGDDDDGD